MSLSSDLISQFVKITKDTPETKKESVVSGTVVLTKDGGYGIRLDGSPEGVEPIPVSSEDNVTTTELAINNRVLVTIRNHTAIVTGNLSSPSVGAETVTAVEQTANAASSTASSASTKVDNLSDQIAEFGTVFATKVETSQLRADLLAANKASFDTLTAEDAKISGKVSAAEGAITELKSKDVEISGKVSASEGEISKLKTDKLDATVAKNTYATIENLTATNTEVNTIKGNQASFEQATAGKFDAVEADIEELNSKKLSATDIEGKYANIDFSNIGTAAVEKFYAVSGLIKNVTLESGTVVKELVGVLIKGDLIEGGTIAADKLIVKGEDGLYYKLNVNALGETTAKSDPKYQNGLDGSVIIAKSIAAEKISVSDLKAFGATIGGFSIGDSAIHSVAKTSATNTTRGIYMDNLGQFVVGDASNYIKYFKDTDGQYKLDISMMSKYATKTDIEAINSKFEHDQLIVNGGGEMGNDTNFSSLIFDGAVTNNSAGSFTSKAKYYQNIYTDEMFLVNPQREYTLSVDLRTLNKKAIFYAFPLFMDIDKQPIEAAHHMYMPGSSTTLARDLKPGDTVAYLADVSGWKTDIQYATGLIIWNYTNSYGYTYPPETYSRIRSGIVSTNGYPNPDTIDFENNTVALNASWAGSLVPAGTAVSQGRSGSTYKYMVTAVIPPNDGWRTYSGKISGIDYSGNNDTYKFPPGAAYTRIGFLWNYNSVDDQIWMTNLSFRDTTEMTSTQAAISETKASIKATSEGLAANVTETTNLGTRMSTVEQTASGLSVKLNDLRIGGRNLFKNSKGPFRLNPDETNNYLYYGFDCDMELNETYAVSADIEVTDGDVTQVSILPYPGGKAESCAITASGRVSRIFTKTTDTIVRVLIYAGIAGSTAGNGIIIRNVKIEKGNQATDWTPAPEDVDNDISSASKTATNFMDLSSSGLVVGDMTAATLCKNLLIGSTDIRIRTGTTDNAVFAADKIELAKNNASATISMLNDTFKIHYESNASTKGLGVYGKTSTGEERLAFQPVNENDNLTLGWGGYIAGANSANIYGYRIHLIGTDEITIGSNYGDDPAVNKIRMLSLGEMTLESGSWKINAEGNLFGKSSSGSFVELIGLSSDNNTAIGHGGYSAKLGKTNIYGNKIQNIVNTTGGSVTYKPYYEAGDSVEIEWYGAGFVSTSGTVVFFSIPLSKPIIGSPSVAAANASSTGGLRVRQAGNYVYGATSSTHAKPSSYKAAVSGEGNYVRIEATMANSTNAVNNDACGVHALIKITFS